MTTLWKFDHVIDKIIKVLKCFCKAGAHINNVAHLFAETDVVSLNCQMNLKILKPPDKLPLGVDINNTAIIKQRSDIWFQERNKVKVTEVHFFNL